jgi:hypothetical protein
MECVRDNVLLEERLKRFDACFNFRDLGGYRGVGGRRLRWERVFRSDSLHRMTRADRERLVAMGPMMVIDLRAKEEIADFGRLSPETPGIEWAHLPLIASMSLRSGQGGRPPTGEELSADQAGEGYYRFLGDGRMATSVLSRIASAEGPVVFHCTSGKDRTGVIAAMMLSLLGVPDETIAADYVLTQETLPQAREWIAEHEPDFFAFLSQIPPERRVLRADRILGFLDRVRSAHGLVEGLVRSAGMSDETLARFRERLLE